MNSYIYVEGGGSGRDSKRTDIQCQQAFQKLLAKMGFTGRKPRLVACGGHQAVHGRFVTRHSGGGTGYIAMWIDSEDPVSDPEQTWGHLKTRDNWDKPAGASDEQVLFMTTCMETWIVADRETLKKHYGHMLQESALPPTNNLESRGRSEVHDRLAHATRDCSDAYAKGKRAFLVVGELNPAALEPLLPSFARAKRILNARL